ncbi:MAG: Rne/Rng family ribonuclease [Myxococcales bacterium]|nr:Rne/Rng family ribonuclease [Myxococcales bacterium]
MANLLLINADSPETRVALIEDGTLAELHVERDGDHGIVGNIYKGRVVRVLPGMQAAFVDIGIGRAAFLYAGDVEHGPALRETREGDPEMPVSQAPAIRQAPPIQQLLREGQELLVQVAKEPIGTKGARITSHISLAGRQLVLMPTVSHVGVSRRITDDAERERLREAVERIRPAASGDDQDNGEPPGFIVRTVAEGQSESNLQADMAFLLKLWRDIERRAGEARSPSLIYRDLDLSLRMVRDLFSEDIERLVIDDVNEYERIREFVGNFMPLLEERVELYQDSDPIFDGFGVELEIDRATDRKVWLKSGGYLVIDQSEALTSIDVNTGRFVGYRNLQDTIVKTNLEAVKEVVNQLRLRNIGGLIIIDFIDMEREADRNKVWQALQTALKADRTRTNVLEISALGLVEMTRKRVRESLLRQLTEPCPYCAGRGYLKSATTVCYDVLREIRRQAASLPGPTIVVAVHPQVADLLADEEQDYLEHLERRFARKISVLAESQFHVEQFEIRVNVDK